MCIFAFTVQLYIIQEVHIKKILLILDIDVYNRIHRATILQSEHTQMNILLILPIDVHIRIRRAAILQSEIHTKNILLILDIDVHLIMYINVITHQHKSQYNTLIHIPKGCFHAQ